MENQGSRDVVAFAQSLGIVQLSSEEKLDVKKAMISLSAGSMQLFFDHDFTYCKSESREILCLEHNGAWKFSEIFEFNETMDVLKNLKIDEAYKVRIVQDFESFLKMKTPIQDQFKTRLKSNSNESIILTIKEINERYPSSHIDWLEMFNNQMLNDSRRSLNYTILIRYPHLLGELHKLFVGFDET